MNKPVHDYDWVRAYLNRMRDVDADDISDSVPCSAVAMVLNGAAMVQHQMHVVCAHACNRWLFWATAPHQDQLPPCLSLIHI